MADYREVAQDTAKALRQTGVDSKRAEKVGQEIARHLDRKASGLPVPERFRPIHDSKPKR